ncbi:MAG: hypothetical protein CVU63_08955, partial [Deltaproteobacteria bacterium HGW-Deltaproteobacteria-20]
MRKRRPARVGRWIARVLCILFALIGLLPVLAGVLLRTEMARTWASEQARTLLHEETGLDGSFHASVRPWPLTIVVDDLEILATDEAGPALTVDQLTLRPQLFSLLQGRMNAGDIEVERPHVRLVVRDGKVANLDLHTRPRDDAPQPVERAPFSSLAVNDAHLDLTVDDLRVSGREIDIDVSASEGPVFDLAVRTGRVHVDSRGRLAFTGHGAPDPVDARHEDSVCELDARVRVEPDAVLIRRVRLSGVADLDPEQDTRPSCLLPGKDLRRVELELRLVRAVLDDEGPASVAGHVRARTPLRLANRFFEFLPLQGWVATQVDGAWHRGQKLPDVWGTVQGEGIALGIYRIASVLSAKARIDAGVVRVPEAQVGFADGMVKIKDAEVRPLAEGIPLRAAR